MDSLWIGRVARKVGNDFVEFLADVQAIYELGGHRSTNGSLSTVFGFQTCIIEADKRLRGFAD